MLLQFWTWTFNYPHSKNIFEIQKEMTRAHPYRLLSDLISLIFFPTSWLFEGRAAKLQNKDLSFRSALFIPTVSTNTFHSANLFLFSRHHIPTNSVAPFSADKYTHNSQFLQPLWWRANAPNVSFLTLYSGQFTLSTQLIVQNYTVILSLWCSTTVF